MSSPVIRQMRADEAAAAIAFAAAEGWNPGKGDAQLFYNTDPTGFFVVEADGVMAGCISAVRYDKSFGFIGLYIMKPEYRGKGLGMKLWRKAMQYLDGCNIGLDGVVAQQENYEKSGFRFAYNNIRYQYTVRDTDNLVTPTLLRIAETEFEELAAFDRQYFPANREKFLQPWIKQQGSTGYAAVQDGALTGYIVLRPCVHGHKVGPLFARDAVTAKQLFEQAVSGLGAGALVYLDVPQPNGQAMALAEEYGMEKVFETARMYTQAVPDINLDGVYGVTSFELG
jgi:GNAT superfamily N-acetyltransferase